MSTAVKDFETLVLAMANHDGVASGQMFGKACLKVHGKAFVAQHQETVVFKLNGHFHEKAIKLSGATLWDPSGKGRPMKEWVALTYAHNKKFAAFAKAALEYVSSAEPSAPAVGGA